jgi:ABC-type nitrate/sulfonate/bicarbonate transport system permease component
MSRSSRFRAVLPGVTLVACAVATWQLATAALGADRLPGVPATLRGFVQSVFSEPIIEAQGGGPGGYWPHAMATLRNTLAGVLGGAALGVLASLLTVQWRPVMAVYDSIVEIVRVLPPLILIPFAILLSDSADRIELTVVALYSALSMSLYTIGACAALPPEYSQMARLLGAGRLRNAFSVQLPAILPSVIGPLRVNAALGTGICVVCEFLAVPKGIGRVMKFALSFYRVDLILVGVLWAILCVLVVEALVSLLCRPFLRWL